MQLIYPKVYFHQSEKLTHFSQCHEECIGWCRALKLNLNVFVYYSTKVTMHHCYNQNKWINTFAFSINTILRLWNGLWLGIRETSDVDHQWTKGSVRQNHSYLDLYCIGYTNRLSLGLITKTVILGLPWVLYLQFLSL